jgi:hypothetical protein
MAEKIHFHDSRSKMFPWKQDLEDQDQAYNPFIVAGKSLSEDANVFTTSGEMAPLTTILSDKIEVDSKEFKTFITLENKPKMSTVNFEGIRGIQSTSDLGSQASGVAVEFKKEPIEVNSVFISNKTKQGRGHPCVSETTTTTVEPQRLTRGRPPTAKIIADIDFYDKEIYSAMSNTTLMYSSEQKEVRYQRMRQFNNAASKRCRIKRKIEIEAQFDKQILLTARNMELRDKVTDLESQVTKIRTELFKIIKNKQSEKVITRSDQVQTHPALAQSTTCIPQNDTSILSFDLEFF